MAQLHPIQNDVVMLVTTTLHKRKPLFKNPAFAREAIETLYRVQERYPFFLYAFVVMPDHCHFLVRVPAPGTISKIMNIYKGVLSSSIGLGPIWQPRFHLRIPRDHREALYYIHRNPMMAGLTESPEQYPWSSASGKWDVDNFFD